MPRMHFSSLLAGALASLSACEAPATDGPRPDPMVSSASGHVPCPFSKFDAEHTIAYGLGTPLGSEIQSDAHFTADNLYLINGSVEVRDRADLTIDAGTTICMGPSLVGRSDQGTLMISNGPGHFRINGTATQHVTFTSQSRDSLNYWNGITIYSDLPDKTVEWHYVDIVDAGEIGGGGATLVVGRSGAGPLLFDHVSFQHMRGKGLVFSDPRGLSADSSVTVGPYDETDPDAGTMTPWLSAHAEAAGTFGPAQAGGENRLQFTGMLAPKLRDYQVIQISGPTGSNLVENDLTWAHLGVPYGVSDLGIGRSLTSGAPPVFRIQPGVTIQFEDFGILRIGALSGSEGGILQAIGTATSPITFTSRHIAPQPNQYWSSVHFGRDTNASASTIQFARFRYGGQGGNGSMGIYVCTSDNASGEIAIERQANYGLFAGPTITDNVFENSIGDGIRGYCRNLSGEQNCLSTRYDSGSRNTFTGIAGANQSAASCP